MFWWQRNSSRNEPKFGTIYYTKIKRFKYFPHPKRKWGPHYNIQGYSKDLNFNKELWRELAMLCVAEAEHKLHKENPLSSSRYLEGHTGWTQYESVGPKPKESNQWCNLE
ncbi:hypothetical protein CR513_50156, partial [Mucuna pruriens]